MSWNLPDCAALVEDRLNRAHAELLEDARMEAAAHGAGEESPRFLVQLTEEKFGASAQAAFSAAEASLRAAATELLLQQGLSVDATRQGLESAGSALRHPAAPRRWTFEDWTADPWLFTSLGFCAWTFLALGVWLYQEFSTVLLVLLIAVGIVPAFGIRQFSLSRVARLRRRVVDEYPDAVHRHYVRIYQEGVRSYERMLDQLTEQTGGRTAPSRETSAALD